MQINVCSAAFSTQGGNYLYIRWISLDLFMLSSLGLSVYIYMCASVCYVCRVISCPLLLLCYRTRQWGHHHPLIRQLSHPHTPNHPLLIVKWCLIRWEVGVAFSLLFRCTFFVFLCVRPKLLDLCHVLVPPPFPVSTLRCKLHNYLTWIKNHYFTATAKKISMIKSLIRSIPVNTQNWVQSQSILLHKFWRLICIRISASERLCVTGASMCTEILISD